MASPNRATEDTKFALIKTFTVASGQAATLGKCGTLTNGGLVQNSAADAQADVVFLASAAAGARVPCALLAGPCILKVLVGTGGATASKYAVIVSDGVTDVPAVVESPSHLTDYIGHNIVGKFIETGVAGDYVGMVPKSLWLLAAT